jgi:DNA-binding NtrC family response regulator
MVIDDESDIILIFRKSLELSGYGVFAFTDPIEALEHFKLNKDRYGLIISDVRMPQMTGLELFTKIREIDTSIPLILMSAFETASTEINPALNISIFLQKPIKPRQLNEIVSKYLPLAAK